MRVPATTQQPHYNERDPEANLRFAVIPRIQVRIKAKKDLNQVEFNLSFNTLCLVVRNPRAEAALF